MPRIIRAEFLSYSNPERNSDKLFNIFLIRDDDCTYRCLTEYGRRGKTLVRDTLCTKATLEAAESKLRQKLSAKRNHRETPYSDYSFGSNYSSVAGEYGFDPSGSNRTNQPPKANILAVSAAKREERKMPKQKGILNQSQFDSLEI